MRLAVTGATGLVGRFIVEEAFAAGDTVLSLSRSAPATTAFSRPVDHVAFDLRRDTPPLKGCDALIHLAFAHEPGRYRGGEGNDPAGFRRANLDGSLRLFEAARVAGVGRVLFLSSRAVYGGYPPGTRLHEDLPPRPDTLYGEVKWEAEKALAALHRPGLFTASLRSTGVYGATGPGKAHKWRTLFEDFRAGRPISPRVATEVHGRDIAAAARLLLRAPPDMVGGAAVNVSDLMLDRHDLLAEVSRLADVRHPLPPRADATRVREMDCTRLRVLGWSPGGWKVLRESLPGMIDWPRQESS